MYFAITGGFDFGLDGCWLNSLVNLSVWVQHIIMFALLKADKILLSVLPIGDYRVFNITCLISVYRKQVRN